MALHPFQTFRRNQKTLLAALTIMCMFIFILQFGKGDVLDRMMTFFGAGRQRETTVTKVYGDKVTDQDLARLRAQRDLADNIMRGLAGTEHGKLLDDLRKPEALKNFDETQKIMLRTVVRQHDQRFDSDRVNPVFRELLPGQYLTPEQSREQVFRDHDLLQGIEQSLVEKNETDKARTVRELMSVLEYEMWYRDLFRRQPKEERLIFGGSLTTDSLLDFLMWKKQADKLGISLTQADIRAEINREFANPDAFPEDANQALPRLAQMASGSRQTLTLDDIYKALGDELRVSLAQSALLGYPPGVRSYHYAGLDVNHVPATATPEEFWKYFLDNRTTLRTELLPIKVDTFLAQVGQPPADSDKDLRDLFNRYKEVEYNPDLDHPAFKEPRRVGVEWVSLRQDSPKVKEVADQHILSMVGMATINPFPAVVLTAEILQEYDRFKMSTYSMPNLLDGSFALAYYRNVTKPADVASLFGLAGGSGITGADPTGVIAGYTAGIVTRNQGSVASAIQGETRRRTGVDATLVLAALQPWTAAGLVQYASRESQALPLEVVKRDVLDRVRDEKGHRILKQELETVQTELEKLKGRPEEERKKEADKYLTEAIKKYGLNHGKTEKPRDFYDIGEDKGLKELHESYRVHPPREDLRGKYFSSLFFDNTPAYLPERWPSVRGQMAMFFDNWGTSEEPFLYWKTSDQKAYVPTYEEARPKVVEAWRFQKARELARKEAERIQNEARQHKSQSDGIKLMRDESAKHANWGEMFALGGIARLVPVFAGGAGFHQYGPYQVDDDRMKARSDFVDQLMRALKEPGDATIVWNRPETIYYVTLLTDINRPTEKEFYNNYSAVHLPGASLWQQMESDRRRDYRQAILRQMRTEAGTTNGKWDVPSDVRQRIEGRESSSEE